MNTNFQHHLSELQKFMQTQKILQIAPHHGDPWIANVFMGSDSPDKIYFIGSRETKYGQKLLADPELAFATAWCAKDNHMDRKGIQGVGEAVFAEDEDEIATGVELHNKNYPEFAERITIDWVHNNVAGSGVWVITPSYIKYWDDELFGEDESEEFNF